MIGIRLSNRYELLREIGRGGMGAVYLAYDPLLEREVAVKVVTPALLSQEAEERFKRESKVIAKMDHPGIVVVYDVGEHEKSLYYVMPLVRGTNLRTFITDRSLRLRELIHVAIQVAEALEYSHNLGVIHRDVKPENILITREDQQDPRVRITDFGLAVVTTESRLTKSGAMVGTVAYFSPEQISGGELTGRSDIYSLGTVLYECIVGDTPFEGEIQHVLYRILHEDPISPTARGKAVDPELEAVILQCLEKDPERRPARAKEVSEAFHTYRSRLQSEDQERVMLSVSEVVPYRKISPAPFVDRKEEYSELQRCMNEIGTGECQFAIISGEPGIGKTRLVEELELLAKARKIRVLHGRFIEKDQSFPYQGFCDAIQEAFSTRSGSFSSADFADLIPDLVALFPMISEMQEIRSSTSGFQSKPTEVRNMEDRTHVFELLARTFIRIGAGKPLLILLEDLHAAEVSIEALQYVVRRMGATPTFFVGTFRTTEVDKSHPLSRMLNSFAGDRRFSHIALHPFSSESFRTYLELLLNSVKLDDRLITTLFEATEGNPYFAKELVRSLRDAEAIVQDSGGYWNTFGEAGINSDSLPATIQKTVEARIQRLNEELREILSIASVLGKSFEYRDLTLLADNRDLEDAVEKLIAAGFIEEETESRGDRLSFSSIVVRDVLYSQFSRRKRKSLHRKYAEQLEVRHAARLERAYPQLVHHYSEGDVPEKIIEYGLKLARKALHTFSAEEAIRAVKAVLDSLEEDRTDDLFEAEARMLLGIAYRMSGNIEISLKEFEKAIAIFDRVDHFQKVEALIQAAETAWAGRKIEQTAHWVDLSLKVVEEAGARLRLLSIGATVANLQGELEKAKAYLQDMEKLQPVAKDSEEEVPPGGKIVVALSQLVHARHPASANLDEEQEVLSNVYETLFTVDSHGNLFPALCEQWDSMEQGRAFLIILRSDIRSSAGTPVTADDVRNSFEAAITLTSKDPLQAFASLQGLGAFLSGTADHVSGIEVLSDRKLLIRLTEPIPIYPAFLTDARTAIAIPFGQEGSPEYVGTGPFQIRELQTDRALLDRNANYWKGYTTLLDSVEFRLGLSSAQIATGLRSGEYDLVRDLRPQDLDEILKDRRLRAGMVEAPKKNIYFVLFNSASKICSIPAVRKALCGIVNTQDIVRRTLGRFAQPAEGLIPPGILGHDPGRRRHPLLREKVIELLEASKLSPPLRLKAAVHPSLQDRYSLLLKALLKAWSDIGVEVTVTTTSMNTYLQSLQNNQNIDFMIGRYISDYEDPDSFTYAFFHSKAGHFRHYFCSAGMDQLMEDARAGTSPTIREKLYVKMENLLIETGYVLPLFHDLDCRISNARVKRFALRSSPPYVNYEVIGKLSEGISPRKKEGGVLHVPISGEFQSMDPSVVFLVAQMEVLPNVFETLTRELEGARVVPWLASDFTPEEGSRRFRFRLRENVRFHDGRKLTSRDVRYSFERLLQNAESVSRWPLFPIRGAQDIIDGKTRELGGFRILSAFEFLIELEQPVSFYPTLLAYPSTAIVPEGSEQFEGSWKNGCVGTGPFRVVGFQPGTRLETEANPYYWRHDLPRSDGLVYSLGVSPTQILSEFKKGVFSLAWDIFPSDVEPLRRNKELPVQYGETPRLSTYFVVFNIHQGPLADEGLRNQLIHAIDVEGLVRRNLGRLAVPAYGLIPPGFYGHNPTHRIVTPAPRRLPTTTGMELSGIVHSVYEGPYSSVAQELLLAFREQGFAIRNIGQTKSEYYRALSSATADLVVTRWIADYPDPDTFMHGLLHSQKGILGRVCGTPEVDHLIEQGRVEADPKNRQSIYREIEEIIARRALLLPLFHEQAYCFAQSNVEGFQVTFGRTIVPYEKLWLRK